MEQLQGMRWRCICVNDIRVWWTKCKQIPQLYLSLPASANSPPKSLKGFDSIFLTPGQTTTVTMQLSRFDLSIWDVVNQRWSIPSGQTNILIGASSRDIRLTSSITNWKYLQVGLGCYSYLVEVGIISTKWNDKHPNIVNEHGTQGVQVGEEPAAGENQSKNAKKSAAGGSLKWAFRHWSIWGKRLGRKPITPPKIERGDTIGEKIEHLNSACLFSLRTMLPRISRRVHLLRRSFATQSTFLEKDCTSITPPYASLQQKLADVRKVLKRPLTLAEKILYSHIIDPVASLSRGGRIRGETYLQLNPERVAMQDASAQYECPCTSE